MSGAAKAKRSIGVCRRGLVKHCIGIPRSSGSKQRQSYVVSSNATVVRGGVVSRDAKAKAGVGLRLTPAPSHILHVTALLLRMPRRCGLGVILRLVKFVEHLLGRTSLGRGAGIVFAHLKKLPLFSGSVRHKFTFVDRVLAKPQGKAAIASDGLPWLDRRPCAAQG